MTYLTISNVDKQTEEILAYITKKAGGKILKKTEKKASTGSEKGFIDKMEKIIKDIEKDFYAQKKNSHHKKLRKRA